MPKQNHVTDEDLDILGQLGVDVTPEKKANLTAREQRIIAGFEEIQAFVQKHDRVPRHGEDKDIFERLYAVRLQKLRESDECIDLLRPLDGGNLLDATTDATSRVSDSVDVSDSELLAALGIDATGSEDDVTHLKHVRTRAEVNAAEEVAQREPCRNFAAFKPIFEGVQHDLDVGNRTTTKFRDNASIQKGDLFILDGQKILVADIGDIFISDYGRSDQRIRVIYDNGTEIEMLRRSLERSLQRDKTSRRISEVDLGPLFSSISEEDDTESGAIYVLRSLSDNPFIVENREVVHKIGVTGGEVKKRIANAKKDPTYLLAEVEVVASFKLSNLNRKKLERLLHRFFAPARLDLMLKDRFDQAVTPKEWFLVPLPVIKEAVQRLIDGSLPRYRYDPKTGRICASQGNTLWG